MPSGDPLVAGGNGTSTTVLDVTKPVGITSATYYCLAVFHTSLSGGMLTLPSTGRTLLQNPSRTTHRAYVFGIDRTFSGGPAPRRRSASEA